MYRLTLILEDSSEQCKKLYYTSSTYFHGMKILYTSKNYTVFDEKDIYKPIPNFKLEGFLESDLENIHYMNISKKYSIEDRIFTSIQLDLLIDIDKYQYYKQKYLDKGIFFKFKCFNYKFRRYDIKRLKELSDLATFGNSKASLLYLKELNGEDTTGQEFD